MLFQEDPNEASVPGTGYLLKVIMETQWPLNNTGFGY